MEMDNVASDAESVKEATKKVTWSNVTTKGKVAVKRVQAAMANQTCELLFKKEISEALVPVFEEVYLLIKTNVAGYEAFLDSFPALHDLKRPAWANMLAPAAFNAANIPNGDIKKQLTEMEVRLKSIDQNLPSTSQFINVSVKLEIFFAKNYSG